MGSGWGVKGGEVGCISVRELVGTEEEVMALIKMIKVWQAGSMPRRRKVREIRGLGGLRR